MSIKRNIRFGWIVILICLLGQGCRSVDDHAGQPGIALSFDDHFIDDWYALRPMLKKYGAKVTFYVTCPDSLTADEVAKLRELQLDGHEIGFHGTIHGRSTELLSAYGPEGYRSKELDPGLAHMRSAGFVPTSYAHPGGNHDAVVDSVLFAHGFKILRDVAISRRELYGVPLYTLAPRIMNSIYYSFDKSREVDALLIDTSSGLTKKDFHGALLRAKQDGSILMLFGHQPLPTHPAPDAYGFDVIVLEYILQESADMGLRFYTMSELPDL